jgi:hypothetical protein
MKHPRAAFLFLLALCACSDPLEPLAADAGPADAGADGAARETGLLDLAPPPDRDVLDVEPPDERLACEFRVTEGPDLGVPDCPSAVPIEGQPCQPLTGIGICQYRGACDADDWSCVGGQWKVSRGRSCSTCPGGEPTTGSSCASLGEWRPGYLCAWPRSGGYSYGTCHDCRWQVGGLLNTAECPPSAPVTGSSCTVVPELGCNYASACHSVDSFSCIQGKWEVRAGTCS